MDHKTNIAGIILSGAYISEGMVSEYGLLPPSFLPLANTRLYNWQVEGLKTIVGNVTIVFPEDFQIDANDLILFEKEQVGVCPVAGNRTLGNNVAHLLANLSHDINDIVLLFGDTLLTNYDAISPETIAVGFTQEYSRWGHCRTSANGVIEFVDAYDVSAHNESAVVAGCFRLTPSKLLGCLKSSNMDFYAALNLYSAQHGLKLAHLDQWHDFGHINTYFRSRQHFTTERVFNHIKMDNRGVSKYSDQTLKMLGEISWFEAVPSGINAFLPRYLGRTKRNGMIGYTTEYVFLPTISELFVYGRLPSYVWTQIFVSCREFLEVCRQYKAEDEIAADFWWLYADKTQIRLNTLSQQRGWELSKPWRFNERIMPSLQELFEQTLSYITPPTNKDISITHGDFHFANIFFDARSLGIKTIDPRGIMRNVPSLFGDYRYDIAKLSHSVCGLYDYIIAGVLKAQVNDDYSITFKVEYNKHIEMVQAVFASMEFNGLSPQAPVIKAIVILLFLSMLPLHHDDVQRQNTLLANVFRLYEEMQHSLGAST